MKLDNIDSLISLCEKRYKPQFSHFLDAGEQAEIEDKRLFANYMMFGGHEECERKIFGVFPEWENPNCESFPITIIKISHRFKKELTHRDYLGTIMSLGIERDRVGDIFVYEGYAVIFLSKSIEPYITASVKKIASVGVSISLLNEPITPPDKKTKTINVIAASKRCDAILAAALNISRNTATELIQKEYVSINHRKITDRSKTVSENDLFSAKGFGRFSVLSFDGETRSERIHLTILKYL